MTFDLNYPRDLKENLIWRYKLLTKADSDIDLQKLLKAYCKHNLIFFINVFVYTYDPRKTFYTIVDLPFILFEAQEKFALDIRQAIDDQTDLALEKSRDEGATWIVLAVLLHLWLFEEGGSSLIGSITEDLVHKSGDMSTLFPKLEYMVDNLPKWLKPKEYDSKQHSNYMRLKNPELNNIITGATGDHFGRSGRVRATFMDELPAWANGRDDKAWTSSQQTTKSRIAIGTPLGQYGLYYNLVTNTGNAAIRKARIHWTDDPRKTIDLEYLDCAYTDYNSCPAKNEELFLYFKGDRSKEPKAGYTPTSSWYREECRRMMSDPNKGDKGIKQEIDIHYIGTGQTYFDQEMIESRRKLCKEPLYKGELLFFKSPSFKEGKPNFEPEAIFQKKSMGECWIWEMPLDDPLPNQYAFSCDYAKGLNDVNDYTSISVMNRETRETVFRYHGRTEEADILCYQVWLFYNKAGYFTTDATGNSAIAILIERYGVKQLARIDYNTGEVQSGKGFNFSKTSKELIFRALNYHLNEADFYEPDERFFLQARTFIRDKGVLKGAGKGELQSHDDIIDDVALLLHSDENMPDIFYEKLNKNRETYTSTYQESYHVSNERSSVL
jgi:hypothetical protein